MGCNNFNDFIGKKIEETYINPSKDYMLWKVDGKWYDIAAVGDCCSHSWFEHCDNASAFNNATLLEFENTYSDDVPCDYDNVIAVNMLKFKTDKGYCTIEFRNESNGYYSGWAEIVETTANINSYRDAKKLEDF